MNDVYANELECSLLNKENPHLRWEFCTENESRLDSSSSQDVFVQHVYNLEPAKMIYYNLPAHL